MIQAICFSNPELRDLYLNSNHIAYKNKDIPYYQYRRNRKLVNEVEGLIEKSLIISPTQEDEEKIKLIKPLIYKTDSSGHPQNYYYL